MIDQSQIRPHPKISRPHPLVAPPPPPPPTAHLTRRLCVSCSGNFSIGENGLFCIGCVLTMEAPIARAVALWHEVGGYATSRLGVS